MAVTSFVAKITSDRERKVITFTLTKGAQNDVQSFDGYVRVIEGAFASTESSGALTDEALTITTSNNLKFTSSNTGSVRGIVWGYD